MTQTNHPLTRPPQICLTGALAAGLSVFLIFFSCLHLGQQRLVALPGKLSPLKCGSGTVAEQNILCLACFTNLFLAPCVSHYRLSLCLVSLWGLEVAGRGPVEYLPQSVVSRVFCCPRPFTSISLGGHVYSTFLLEHLIRRRTII